MSKAETREHLVLLVANLAIIAAAETIGGGSYFFETRLIQSVALLFTVLPLVRVFTNFKVYDPTIVRVVQASLVAMIIFTESHATAYAGHFFFRLDDDTVQALVANFSIAGLLTLIIGAEMVLAKIGKRPKALVWLPTLAFLGVSGLSIAYASGSVRPSLSASSALPLAYAVAMSAVVALGYASFNRLRTKLPLLKGFVAYFMAGASCVAVSAISSFFVFVLAAALEVPAYQITYAGAFSFFAAVSLMFLAFGKLRGFGGIYKDLQEEEMKS